MHFIGRLDSFRVYNDFTLSIEQVLLSSVSQRLLIQQVQGTPLLKWVKYRIWMCRMCIPSCNTCYLLYTKFCCQVTILVMAPIIFNNIIDENHSLPEVGFETIFLQVSNKIPSFYLIYVEYNGIFMLHKQPIVGCLQYICRMSQPSLTASFYRIIT